MKNIAPDETVYITTAGDLTINDTNILTTTSAAIFGGNITISNSSFEA